MEKAELEDRNSEITQFTVSNGTNKEYSMGYKLLSEIRARGSTTTNTKKQTRKRFQVVTK